MAIIVLTVLYLLTNYEFTYIFDLILGNESREVEFSLVVGEEVPALCNRLSLYGGRQSFVVFATLPDHCTQV